MSTTFGLKFQSRVLTAVTDATDKSAWIVATNSLREENEIRVVEFDEKSETLISTEVCVHQNEVWDLALSPSDSKTFITAHNSGSVFGVTMWSMGEHNEPLTKVCDTGPFEHRVERIRWGAETNILTLEDTKIKKWDVADGTANELSCGLGQDLDQFSNMLVSKRDSQQLYISNGQGFELWDLREMMKVRSVEYAHDMPLRNIDEAGHCIATCGDDCFVKIWDTRNLDKTVLELNGHSHWVWDCKFNQKFPSLLLTASSDASVILWDIKSTITEGDSPRSMADGVSEDNKVGIFTDHDESVYCICWSSVDEWLFASLSYDGRLVINKVPSDVKYRKLL